MTDGPEFKEGVCRWCALKGTVFADNSLCEECDADVIRCEICGDEQSRSDTCRHVFQDRNLEWRGSGIGWEHNGDGLKEPFFKLLAAMPDGFAADLREAIRSGQFHTWFSAPMIGLGGVIMELNGMPVRDGRAMALVYGDALLEVSERDSDSEELEDAYYWLASLYDDKTPKANAETIRWIDEWLTARVATGPRHVCT